MDPWPKPVDGAQLLEDLATAARRFVILPKHADALVALWCLAAHAFNAFDIFPFLALVSPVRRCGKTTLFKVLLRLVPRALTSSNVSAASVYRIIEACRPCLLLDEADTFTRDNEELRGVLNSGHTRETAYVLRVEGEGKDLRPVRLSTWCPRAFALIGSLPDTLDDRSIAIPMRRRTKTEVVARARRKALEPLRDLGRMAARWGADNTEALAATDPAVPEALDDRASDNWEPLLAVADLTGGPWPERARKAALALSGGRDQEDDGAGTRLLRNIRAAFEARAVDRLPSAELVAALLADEEWGWGTWRRGKPLDQRGLARLLAPFGIKPRGIRVGTDTPKGYTREWFTDAWSRYLGSDRPHLQQDRDAADLDVFFDRNKLPRVADAKSPLSGDEQSIVADVADEKAIRGDAKVAGASSLASSMAPFEEEF